MATKGGPKGKAAKAETTQRSQRLTLMALLAAVAIAFGGLVWAEQAGFFSAGAGASCENVTGSPSSPVHDHAVIYVYLNSSQPYNFGTPDYQVQDSTLHFERGAGDAAGAQMHIHLDRGSARPSIACFMSTLDWIMTEDRIRTDKLDNYEVGDGFTLTYRAGRSIDDLRVVGPDYQMRNGDIIEVRYEPGAGGTDTSSDQDEPPADGNGTATRRW